MSVGGYIIHIAEVHKKIDGEVKHMRSVWTCDRHGDECCVYVEPGCPAPVRDQNSPAARPVPHARRMVQRAAPRDSQGCGDRREGLADHRQGQGKVRSALRVVSWFDALARIPRQGGADQPRAFRRRRHHPKLNPCSSRAIMKDHSNINGKSALGKGEV